VIPLSDHELWEYIREDLPYLDLTTHLLDLPGREARFEIVARHDAVAACTAEAGRIGELLGCRVATRAEEGRWVEAGTPLLTLEGEGEALHAAWRLCQILLEYACGMATYAAQMLRAAREQNPRCEISVTRKSFPFAKRFSIRALQCGGVLPHRLGLSETILVFDRHRGFYESKAAFEAAFKKLLERSVEKKVVVESESYEDALYLMGLGAHVVQLDKITPETLAAVAAWRDANAPQARLLAAGGINLSNVAEFARSGADAIVTSSPYQAKSADLTAKWSML